MERDLSFEYVLGALDGEKEQDFERQLAADPKLYQAVVDWENSLAPLAAAAPKLQNPVDFSSIEAELFPKSKINWIKVILFAIITLAVIKGAVGVGLVFSNF